MRLWTLHPEYLDPRGLVALWREALLAQAVLRGQTRGYTQHPQLVRFRSTSTPVKCIAEYLRVIHAEAMRRGYHFDASKIAGGGRVEPVPVTQGQLDYEWQHLEQKLQSRSPAWLSALETDTSPASHPLFRIIPGGVAEWEIIQPGQHSKKAR